MAIAKIKKLEVIGFQKDKDRFLNYLQNLGVVEIVELKKETQTIQAVTTNINLLELEEAVSYLAKSSQKSNFLESMFSLKPWVFGSQLKEVLHSFDYQKLIVDLTALRKHLQNLSQHKEKLLQETHLLSPWKKLNIPLEQIHPTNNFVILLGAMRQADFSKFLKKCEKERIKLFSEVINQDKANAFLVIIGLKRELQILENILKDFHFNFVALGKHKGTAIERLSEINRDIISFDSQIGEAKRKIAELSEGQFKLMVIHDHFLNIKNREEIDRNLTKQQYTFSLSGWIKKRDAEILEKQVSSSFENLAIFISEPASQDDVPVLLENNALIRPFEFITKIYGMPKYHEVDPTPYLAPFFFLYFGFCVSDVGYGLMLALICWFVLKRFKMGPQGQKAFKLFFFCGISTIIIGALTGSWFGNLFDLLADNNKFFIPLKNFKDSLIIIDPLKDATKLLGVALSLGIIQVWFGNVVAAIGNIKNKRYLDILLDQVSTFIFLFGLTGFGLSFLNLVKKAPIFTYTTLIGAVALILTQGRSEKGIGSKLFFGTYNLYSALSGYLSDILSYSRLWALGMVTGVMAATINLIAIQFSGIVSSSIPLINKIGFLRIIVSVLVLVFIFIAGHLVAFMMNLLGAFVHPVRLQFVEFFSKFFKATGRPFRPFRVESRYVNFG